jgi:hypothetical protein
VGFEIVLINGLRFDGYQIVFLAKLVNYQVYKLIAFAVVFDFVFDVLNIQINSIHQQVHAFADYQVRVYQIETANKQMVQVDKVVAYCREFFFKESEL